MSMKRNRATRGDPTGHIEEETISLSWTGGIKQGRSRVMVTTSHDIGDAA
jgi:hypothetical protein